MAKTGEVSLRASERLKDFDPNKFKTGDEVAYKSGGQWKPGKLENPTAGDPVAYNDGRHITLFVGGQEIKDINVSPKKIEFAVSDVVPNVGEVLRISLGPNGEIWYDIKVGKKTLRGVEQSALMRGREASKIESDLEQKVNDLVVEIKKIQGEKRAELMERLNSLKEKSTDLQKLILVNQDILDKMEESELDATRLSIEAIEQEIQTIVKPLEVEIKDAIRQEQAAVAPGGDQVRGRAAQSVESRLTGDIELADEKVGKKFKIEYDIWDANNKKFLDWKKEVADTEAALKVARGTQGKKGQPGQPGNPVEEARLNTELTRLNTVGKVKDPGVEPKEKLPSADQEFQDQTFLRVFEEMDTKTGLPADLKDLLDEVKKQRAAKAGREGFGGDYPPGSPQFGNMTDAQKQNLQTSNPAGYQTASDKYDQYLIYRRNTVEILHTVIDDWKKKAGPEVKGFDFDKEQQQLKDRAEALEQRAKDAKKPDLALRVRNEVVTPLLVLAKNTTNVDKTIIDLWDVLGKIQVEIFKAEQEVPPKRVREAKVQFVDLPKNLMKEWLVLQAPLMKEALGDAYLAKINEGSEATTPAASVEKKMKQFINGITMTPDLRATLASHGIKDWEAFKQQWEDKMAKDFSGLLMEQADTELKTKIFQSVRDIKSKELTFGSNPKQIWANAKERYHELWDYSALANMKAAAAWRMLLNVAVLGGTGFGVSLLTRIIPSAAVRATLVGGAVGAVKAGMQRLMGKDGGYFQEQMKQGKKEAENKKKLLIRDELLKSAFTGDQFNAGSNDKMAYLFTAALRRTSEKEAGGHEKTIPNPDGGEGIKLVGDEVCLYFDALKYAAEDEGENIEESEKTKYAFAAALFAMRHNKRFDITEVPPAAVKATQWLMDAYTGRIAAKPGRPSVSFAEGTEGEKVDFKRQALVTAGMGAAVCLAIEGGKNVLESEFMETGLTRGFVGGAIGVAVGERAQYQAERSKADKKSGEFLNKFTSTVDALLVPLPSLAPQDVAGGETDAAFKVREQAYQALEENRVMKVEESNVLLTFLLQGANIKEIPPISRFDKADMKFLTGHTKDIAGLLQKDQSLRSVLESLRREISRSGDLQKAGIIARLKSMEETGKELAKAAAAENSTGVKVWNSFLRHARGAAYGVASAGVSIGAGMVIDKVRVAMFGDSGHRFVSDETLDARAQNAPADVALSTGAKGAAAVAGVGGGAGAQEAVSGARGGEAVSTARPVDSRVGDPTRAEAELPPTQKGIVHSPDVDAMAKASVIKGGEGPEHQISRQLKLLVDANKGTDGALVKMGFKGNPANAGEVKDWINNQAHRVAIDNKLFDPDNYNTTSGKTGGKLHLSFDEHTGKYKTEFGKDTETITMRLPPEVKVAPVVHEEVKVEAPHGRTPEDFAREHALRVKGLTSGGRQIGKGDGPWESTSQDAERILQQRLASVPDAKGGDWHEAGNYKLTAHLPKAGSPEYNPSYSADSRAIQAEILARQAALADDSATDMDRHALLTAFDQYRDILANNRWGDLHGFRQFLTGGGVESTKGADVPAQGLDSKAAAGVTSAVENQRGTANLSSVSRGGGGGGGGARVEHGPSVARGAIRSEGSGGTAPVSTTEAKPAAPGPTTPAAEAATPKTVSGGVPPTGESSIKDLLHNAKEKLAQGVAALSEMAEKTDLAALRIKALDTEDAIADYIGKFSYSGKGAEFTSNLMDKINTLSSQVVVGRNPELMSKLANLDQSTSPTDLFKELKGPLELNNEVDVFRKDGSATISGEGSGGYRAVVSDVPSHAIAFLDANDHRTIFGNKDYDYSTDDHNRVVMTGKGGDAYLAKIGFDGKHEPMAMKGEPLGAPGPVEPDAVTRERNPLPWEGDQQTESRMAEVEEQKAVVANGEQPTTNAENKTVPDSEGVEAITSELVNIYDSTMGNIRSSFLEHLNQIQYTGPGASELKSQLISALNKQVDAWTSVDGDTKVKALANLDANDSDLQKFAEDNLPPRLRLALAPVAPGHFVGGGDIKGVGADIGNMAKVNIQGQEYILNLGEGKDFASMDGKPYIVDQSDPTHRIPLLPQNVGGKVRFAYGEPEDMPSGA